MTRQLYPWGETAGTGLQIRIALLEVEVARLRDEIRELRAAALRGQRTDGISAPPARTGPSPLTGAADRRNAATEGEP